MKVLIPKGYWHTGIEQHNATDTRSIKIYVNDQKSHFVMEALEYGKPQSVGGPYLSGDVEAIRGALEDFYMFLKRGRI